MAAETTDPRTLQGWEDAFQYPIPTVRTLEKKLRGNITEHNEKLRSLVGGSYRSLLQTAQTIVEADGQMRQVDNLLVGVSRRSDSRIVDRIAANHSRLEREQAAQENNRFSVASQLFVLQKCLDVVGRLLRQGRMALLAAKLLVIARLLLHKTLSEPKDSAASSHGFGDRLASLRQKLLRHIDRHFARPYRDNSTIVDDMTAYSLLTSSTPTDVLRHFLHFRLDALRQPMNQELETPKASISNRLQLYLHTQRETRAIFPESLRTSLKALGARPLLEDRDILGIDELSLDMYMPWIANDVRNFTPWTRHDDLGRAKAEQHVEEWTGKALKGLTTSLAADVALEGDLQTLSNLRRDTLQSWLSSKRRLCSSRSNDVLTDMRTPFVARSKELISKTCEDFQLSVINACSAAMNSSIVPLVEKTDPLWEDSLLTMETHDGGLSFRQAILDKRAGRQQRLDQIIQAFNSKSKAIADVQAVVKKMKDIRWEDDFDDEEDEEDLKSWSRALTQEDPEEVQASIQEATLKSIRGIENHLSSTMSDSALDCSTPASIGLFVLRVARQLRQGVPRLLQSIEMEPSPSLICEELVYGLHKTLANALVQQLEPTLSKSLDGFILTRHNVQSLWEGSPPLPIQITAETFGAIRALNKNMESRGPDLWSAPASKQLKIAQRGSWSQAFEQAAARLQDMSSDQKPKTNGIHDGSESNENNMAKTDKADEREDSTEEASVTPEAIQSDSLKRATSQKKEKLLQMLFDALFADVAFSQSQSFSWESDPSSDPLKKLQRSLQQKLELDEAASTRLEKSVNEYWRRTYLLFGLLSN